MKDQKNKRAMIMGIILLGLLIIAYKTMFMNNGVPEVLTSDISTSSDTQIILGEIQSINFDTSVMQDQNFQSLKSIDISVPPLPVGRKNPFSAIGSN